VQKVNTLRPAPSTPLEMFRRVIEGHHEISWPNAAASWRERLRNLADCGKVAYPGAWVREALDCAEIPAAFREELRRQVHDARAAARVEPARSPEPVAVRSAPARLRRAIPDRLGDMPDLDAIAAAAPPWPVPSPEEAADLDRLIADTRAAWASQELPDRFPAPPYCPAPPTSLPANVQAMNAEAFPHFCDFLDALGGTPEEIDAARDRWMIELKLASVRHGVAIPWPHFAPARAAFGLEPRALPWERIVQGGQDGPGVPVAELSAPDGIAERAERCVA